VKSTLDTLKSGFALLRRTSAQEEESAGAGVVPETVALVNVAFEMALQLSLCVIIRL
jgi:hypothetical protein